MNSLNEKLKCDAMGLIETDDVQFVTRYNLRVRQQLPRNIWKTLQT